MLYKQMCKLLASKFKLSLAEKGGVRLKEKKAKMSIDIATAQCPAGTVILKCPTSQEGFLASQYTKICDYIVFIPLGQKTKIVFVELKKILNAENIGDAKKQLLHTTPLLSYIDSALRVHCNYSKIRIEKHYILFFKQRNDRFDKQSMHYNGGKLLPSEKYEDITIKPILGAHEISVGKIIKICESNT